MQRNLNILLYRRQVYVYWLGSSTFETSDKYLTRILNLDL